MLYFLYNFISSKSVITTNTSQIGAPAFCVGSLNSELFALVNESVLIDRSERLNNEISSDLPGKFGVCAELSDGNRKCMSCVSTPLN